MYCVTGPTDSDAINMLQTRSQVSFLLVSSSFPLFCPQLVAPYTPLVLPRTSLPTILKCHCVVGFKLWAKACSSAFSLSSLISESLAHIVDVHVAASTTPQPTNSSTLSVLVIRLIPVRGRTVMQDLTSSTSAPLLQPHFSPSSLPPFPPSFPRWLSNSYRHARLDPRCFPSICAHISHAHRRHSGY